MVDVKINPPPQNVPQGIIGDFKAREFFTSLKNAVSTIFFALGGQDGVPKIFRKIDTPTNDPGWSASASVNMTPPDKYVRVTVDGINYVLPLWIT